MLENLKAQIRQCEYRFTTHQQERKQREEQLKLLKQGEKKIDWRKIDSPERMRVRLERQGLGEVVSKAMADFSTTEDIPELNILERIIEQDELMGISFLLTGAKISRSIGRVVILNYHRNATITMAQGNRNPLIDFPEWIDKIDFALGFS